MFAPTRRTPDRPRGRARGSRSRWASWRCSLLRASGAAIPAVWPASGFALVAMLLPRADRSGRPSFSGRSLRYVDATGQIARPVILRSGRSTSRRSSARRSSTEWPAVRARSDAPIRSSASLPSWRWCPRRCRPRFAAGADVTTGRVVWGDLGLVWITTWLGHLAGTLIVAPLLAHLAHRSASTRSDGRGWPRRRSSGCSSRRSRWRSSADCCRRADGTIRSSSSACRF